MTRKLKFRNPSFSERIKGMLGVDFYRLFHTPMFYIFLAIAAIIPARARREVFIMVFLQTCFFFYCTTKPK